MSPRTPVRPSTPHPCKGNALIPAFCNTCRPFSLSGFWVQTRMVLGGEGTSVASNQALYAPPACRVITSLGPLNPSTNRRPPVCTQQDAPWPTVRDVAHSYGFAAFTLDPCRRPGDMTELHVTYCNVLGLQGELSVFGSFTLQRPRTDAPFGVLPRSRAATADVFRRVPSRPCAGTVRGWDPERRGWPGRGRSTPWRRRTGGVPRP